jgi:hypothetical protein
MWPGRRRVRRRARVAQGARQRRFNQHVDEVHPNGGHIVTMVVERVPGDRRRVTDRAGPAR